MGRKRRRVNESLPKYVYRRPHGYVLRGYKGREDGKTIWGSDIFLCGLDAPMSIVYAAYERATNPDKDSLNWLLRIYHDSPHFKGLMPRTQADYENYKRIITGYKMRNGKPFGEAPIKRIKKTAIRAYLDKYKGGKAPIAANRHIQYLKSAWTWAEQRIDSVPDNPCKGVTLNQQRPRTRYVDPTEYAAALTLATGYIPLFMEFAYLCRARRGEIAALTKADCLPEGIRLMRSKGSEGEITATTPRLRAAIKAANNYNPNAPVLLKGATLIHDKNGLSIKKNALDSAWRRFMDKVEKAGIERFTLHDLKAAGYSEQKVQDAGHKSERMHRVYSRKLRTVEPAE